MILFNFGFNGCQGQEEMKYDSTLCAREVYTSIAMPRNAEKDNNGLIAE